jgi:hypothetical protein
MRAANIRSEELTGRTSWRVQRFTGRLVLQVEVRSEVQAAGGLHWPKGNQLDTPAERMEFLTWRDAVASDMSTIESILLSRKWRDQLAAASATNPGPEA